MHTKNTDMNVSVYLYYLDSLGLCTHNHDNLIKQYQDLSEK